jgi:hypothetical protein
MGSRAEAVFDGDEAYDPRQEYQRGETMLRLAEGCCHLCLRSPPEIALMYAPYGGQGVVPCCVECGASEDQDREEIELEREQNQLHRFRWGWEHHLWEDRNDTKLPRGEARWFRMKVSTHIGFTLRGCLWVAWEHSKLRIASPLYLLQRYPSAVAVTTRVMTTG